jgi:serine/threonine protein kinase
MSLLDDLLDRWEEAREQGEELLPEVLCKEHPDLLPEVRRQIQALKAVSLQFGGGQNEEGDDSSKLAWSPASHFEMLNRFEIIKLHASGGLGHIYLAQDKVLDRPVAIKFLKRADLSPEQLNRFEWEARITGRLEHPGIVPIHSMQESQESSPCYVMRFIDGKTLQQTVEANVAALEKNELQSYFHSNELRNTLNSFATVCNIVAYAHSKGVIHRDIKPGNIMLGPFNETLLLDWGIAKLLSQGDSATGLSQFPSMLQTAEVDTEELRAFTNLDCPIFTATGQAIGTPAYASPEQMQGLEVASSPATDLFSLGATLHFILCGKSPLEYFGWSYYLDQCRNEHSRLADRLPPHVPKVLQAICAKAMATKPEDRYATASDIAKDIQNYLSRDPVSVVSDPWYARLARISRKHPAITGAFAATAVVVFMLTTLFSVLVNAKNQRLIQTTKSLNLSLEQTRYANEQVLQTLRKMYHVVVIDEFNKRSELTALDRDYLEQMSAQYEIFADSLSEDVQSRMMQAEGNYRSAHLLHWISQHDRALSRAKTACELYRELCYRDQRGDLIEDYLESIRLLSEIQTRWENTDAGIALAQQGIDEIADFLAQYSPPEPIRQNWLRKKAALLANIASGHVQREDWREAFITGESAVSQIRSLLAEIPSDQRLRHTLAGELSRLAQLASHEETQCSVETQMEYANQAVLLRQQHLENEPEELELRAGLFRAYFSRALAHFRADKLAESMKDIDAAIVGCEVVRVQYPQRSQFNHDVVEFRLHKLRLLRQIEDWKGVVDQISELRELMLTVEALSLCVDLLLEYRALFPEYALTLEWLAEMHARRASLIGSDAPERVIEDRLSVITLFRQIVAANPDEQSAHSGLVNSILDAVDDSFTYQKLDSANSLLDQVEIEMERIRTTFPDLYQQFLSRVSETKTKLDRK